MISSEKKPIREIIIVLLYAVGAVSVPFQDIAKLFGGSQSAVYFTGAVCKFLLSVFPFYLIYDFGFSGILKNIKGKKSLLPCLSALIIAVNNFPILPIATGEAGLKIYLLDGIAYIFYCVSIGVMEEAIFRGNLFPLILKRQKRNKLGVLKAIIISSAVFGGMHLFNLFSGGGARVFLQVGYSFLMGLVFSLTMLFTGNLFVPIILHAVFDIGGFLFDAFGFGTLWTTGNIVLTAVVSVLTGAILLIEFIKTDYKSFDILYLSE